MKLDEITVRKAWERLSLPGGGGGRHRDDDFFAHLVAMMEWRPEPNRSVRSRAIAIPDKSHGVRSVVFAGDMLVWGLDDGRIRVMAGPRVFEWQAHVGAVADVAPLGNDGRLFSRGLDGVVRRWRLDGTLLREWGGFERAVASAVSGNQIAVASDDLVWFLPGHQLRLEAPVRALTGSPRRGEWFAALNNGSVAWINEDGVISLDSDEPAPLHSVAVSHDRQWLAVGAAAKVDVWSLGSEARKVKTLDEHFDVTALEFDPTGRHLAVGDESCHVCVWRVPEFTVLMRAKHHFECQVTHAAWSPTGDRLAFACHDNGWSNRASFSGLLAMMGPEELGRLLSGTRLRSHDPELRVWSIPAA